MPIEELFKIKRDIAIENIGGFFCQACLVGKTIDEMSPDRRYCQGCYKVLLNEAEMLTGHDVRATWRPKIAPEKPAPLPQQLSFEGMGAKAIVAQLRKRNVKVSYKTVQRVLSGERT